MSCISIKEPINIGFSVEKMLPNLTYLNSKANNYCKKLRKRKSVSFFTFVNNLGTQHTTRAVKPSVQGEPLRTHFLGLKVVRAQSFE